MRTLLKYAQTPQCARLAVKHLCARSSKINKNRWTLPIEQALLKPFYFELNNIAYQQMNDAATKQKVCAQPICNPVEERMQPN